MENNSKNVYVQSKCNLIVIIAERWAVPYETHHSVKLNATHPLENVFNQYIQFHAGSDRYKFNGFRNFYNFPKKNNIVWIYEA